MNPSTLFQLFLEIPFITLLFDKGFSLLKTLFLESKLLASPSTNEITVFLFSNSFIGLFSDTFPNTLLTVSPIHEKASPIGFMIDFQKLAKNPFTFCQLVITRAAPVTSPAIKSPIGLLIIASVIALSPVTTAGKTVADKNENTPSRFAFRLKIVLPRLCGQNFREAIQELQQN
uniref:hypothetical protein n=1 Tax=Wolbachia endosymbiont (group A) of Volucella inflata TaxID=2954065 RepID=UPI002226CDE3|nr:hypothetical protein [Wolbachia endosymbiont (group A) of Volucella inflata]